MGLRVAASRLIGAATARLTTRLLLATAVTASGVGTVLGVMEFLSILLDVMLMAGWDPGAYNNEFDNGLYDDMSRAWRRQRELSDSPLVTPELILALYAQGTEAAVANSSSSQNNDGNDDLAARERLRERREAAKLLTRQSNAPWFFARFPEATRRMVTDSSSVPDKQQRNLEQMRTRFFDPRPVYAHQALLASILFSMHYFGARDTNSWGQRVNTRENDVRLDSDEFVERSVRANEAAAMLTSRTRARYVDRAYLAATARRSIVDKLWDAGGVAVTALFFLGAYLVAFSGGAWGAARSGDRFGSSSPTTVALILGSSLIAAVAVVGFHAAYDGAIRGKRYERADDANDRDPVDRLCDALTDALRYVIEESGGGDSSLSKHLISAAFGGLRDELRIVFGRDTRDDNDAVQATLL